MTPNQFQIAVSILFVTCKSRSPVIDLRYYVHHIKKRSRVNKKLDLLFEIPSNLVLKPFGPRRWMTFIVFSWGVVALSTGFVQNFQGLVALRLLLGIFEAGLFPGLNVYLTFFYTKRELALRVGYLFVSAAIAGAFGGLLAFGIGHLDGVRGMSGWRWIMILEGLPTVLLAFVVWFFLPNGPEDAYFLTPEEKKLMILRHQRHYGSTESALQFSKKDMMAAFKDWRVWVFSIAQFGVDTMLYGKLDGARGSQPCTR